MLQLTRKVVWGAGIMLAMASGVEAQTTIQAQAGTLGVIPDDAGMCGMPGTALDITFTVAGLAPVATVAISLTATHAAVGDLVVTLIAPNNTPHVIFARTGATSDDSNAGAAFLGDGANLNGTYAFSDGAVDNWWATSAPLGPTESVPPGAFRTSLAGGAGSSGAVSSMNAVFAAVTANGTWTLRVVDRCGGDAGSVTAAALTLGSVPPTVAAASDAYAVAFAAPLNVAAPGVLANDSSNGGTLTATLVSGPSSGVLVLDADGSFAYSPTGGFVGDDTFSYRAVSQGVQSAVVTVTLSVAAPPVIIGTDAYATPFETTLHVAAPGVIGNDVSPFSPIEAVLGTGPAHGTVVLAADGSFVYSPATGYSGADAFTYRPRVMGALGPVATVTVDVAHSATAPQRPRSLSVAWVRGSEVALRWQPPAAGPAPTAYLIEGGAAGGPLTASVTVPAAYPIYVATLGSGRYDVRVSAIASGERGSPTDVVTFGVGDGIVVAAPSLFRAAVDGRRVSFSWQHLYSGGTPRNWKLIYVLTAGGTQAGGVEIDGSSEFIDFQGLPEGAYTIHLSAWNDLTGTPGASASFSVPSSCTTAPEPPANVLAYVLNGRIGVVWDPPPSGAAPSHYFVHVSGSVAVSLSTSRRWLSAPAVPGTFAIAVTTANACGDSPPAPSQTIVVAPAGS